MLGFDDLSAYFDHTVAILISAVMTTRYTTAIADCRMEEMQRKASVGSCWQRCMPSSPR